MRQIYYYLLAAAMLALTGCNNEPETVRVEYVKIGPTPVNLVVGGTKQITATVFPSDAADKTVTWSSNDPGVATVSASGLVTAKTAGRTEIVVTTADGKKTAFCTVSVTKPVVSVTYISIKPRLILEVGEVETLTPKITPDDAVNQNVRWLSDNDNVATVDGNGNVEAVAPGQATITVVAEDGGKKDDCFVTVNHYSSMDYSTDGRATLLQAATEGMGIDIVFMGDGYSDRLIADGTYDATMRKAVDYFFIEEPYKSHRAMFNVWSVVAVSQNEVITEGCSTALDCYLGEGTLIGGSDQTCVRYALKAIPSSRMGNAVLVVTANETTFRGTCWMYGPDNVPPRIDGDGFAIAYQSISSSDTRFRQLVHHEANGHAFSKLGDEYVSNDGVIPASDITGFENRVSWGWNKNIDLTSDPAKVKWAKFLVDTRYSSQKLGLYEGGSYWTRGVWRATENSIMRYNTGGFNAPSREAIYCRIHKLAYGADWTYDYETFVAWDMVHWSEARASYSAGTSGSSEPSGHTPPVVVPRSWRDLLNK